MIKRISHISFAELVDVAEEQAAADRELSAHLSGCSRCSTELQNITQLIARMKQDESVDAPRDLLAYAVNTFRRSPAAEKRSIGQRVVAALTFDSFSGGPAFGFRSGPAAARQLIYTAAEHEIDLRIREEDREHWMISGQVLGEDCSGGQVELTGKMGSASGLLNEECEFSLPAVPPGTYALRLLLPGAEVEVTQLEIGE